MSKSNNRYQTDHYTRSARAAGYAARSVYKLIELQRAYGFIRFGQTLLDIGAAPGSWSKYCAEIVGDLGTVVSVDRTALAPQSAHTSITAITGDFFAPAVQQQLNAYHFHGVLSDLSPRTSGNKFVDAFQLSQHVLGILTLLPALLWQNGFALFKLFDCAEVARVRREMAGVFARHYIRKPRASRASSKELYLIGFDYRCGRAIPAGEHWE